jgi:hypothetical protein
MSLMKQFLDTCAFEKWECFSCLKLRLAFLRCSLAIVTVWLLHASLRAAETQTVDFLGVVPGAVNAGQATTVTASARVGVTATLLPAGVTLVRVDAQGKPVSVLGRMYDDGTHGDVLRGDGVFTTQITMNEAQVQTVNFKVSVANKGVLKRTLSDAFPLLVQSVATAESVLQTLGNDLKAGRIETALTYFSSSPRHRTLLTSLSADMRTRLADALQAARLISAQDDLREYEVAWTDDAGRPITLRISMSRTELNQWFIMSW